MISMDKVAQFPWINRLTVIRLEQCHVRTVLPVLVRRMRLTTATRVTTDMSNGSHTETVEARAFDDSNINVPWLVFIFIP